MHRLLRHSPIDMPIGQFLIFFLLLITGFFCKKFGVFTDDAINAINKFIIIIVYPCLILGRTAALDIDHNIFFNFLLAIIINLGLLMLFGAYARLYYRRKHFSDEDRIVAEFGITSPNNGFMGFPIAFTFFGDLGLLYMIGANIALNAFFFTYGIALLNRGRGVSVEPVLQKLLRFGRMMAHPGICAAIAGILLCYNHIKLPEIVQSYLDGIGAIATPLAMISIGTMLAGGFGIQSFKKRLVMEPTVNRLFVMPIISAAVVWFLPINPLVKTLLIVSNSMPVATMVPILSEQHGRNKSLAVEMLVVSTLFSMATIPAVVWALHQIGL